MWATVKRLATSAARDPEQKGININQVRSETLFFSTTLSNQLSHQRQVIVLPPKGTLPIRFEDTIRIQDPLSERLSDCDLRLDV
jgi:hypothetical protein